ncbi:MAG: Ig-like domain-containing protein, partial [Treponemataceae bacterium]|nr:Ig-like domain-containing protein [Treponemataceae bacterium]
MARAGRIPHICARQGETYEKNEDVQARHARGHGRARHHGGGYFLACSSGDDGDGDTPNTPPVTSTQTPSIDIPAINVGEGTYFPKNGETAAYADTILAIQFDDVPTIGTGTVTIYDGDTVVDTINPKGETYYSVNKNYQLFNVDNQLITVSGKTVIIKPHVTTDGYAILSAGKTYSVAIDDGLLQGKVSGADFSGIAKDGWTFTVGAAKTISDHTITVGRSGDFFTIQGALNY